MNTQTKELEIETPTPLEEIKQVDRPRYDVPIMIEITQWDLDNAQNYCDTTGCLIATALTRMGYSRLAVNPYGVTIFSDGPWHNFDCEGIGAGDLQRDYGAKRTYKPELVGKQFILYPENI